jgi:hypothetical protein
MARSHTQRRLGALGWLLALSACDNGYLESTTTIESICTADWRFAVLVELDNPDRLSIDEVTATLENEEQCFLESSTRALDHALYSCLEQGGGRYSVLVRSGERTWDESVDVPANECHVTALQTLTIQLK